VEDFGLTFYDYLQVIRRRIWPFLLILITFPLIVGLSTKKDQPLYRSTIRVKVEDSPANQPLFQEIGGTFRSESSIATQVEIIQSESLAAEVIRTLKQEQYAQAKLKGAGVVWPELDDERQARHTIVKNVKAAIVPNTKIIEVGVYSDGPQKSKKMANTLADAFVEYSLRRKRERISGALDFINNQLEKLRRERIEEEQRLWQYKTTTRFETVGSGLQRLENLDQLHVNTMLERQIDETRLAEIQRIIKQQQGSIVPEIGDYKSPLIERLREKLEELDFQRALKLRDFTPEHPEVKEITYEIEQTQNILSEEVRRLMTEDLPAMDPLSTYRNLLEEMVDLEMDINVKKRRETVLAKTIEQTIDQLDQLANKEIEVSRLSYKIEVKKNTYERFLRKKEEVELSMEMEAGDVQVLDYAFSSINETGHQQITKVAWSAVAGLLGAVGIAFFLDMNDKRVKNEVEVKKFLDLPMLGMIPRIRLSRHQPLVETVAHYEEGTPYAESFRKLRTQIEFKSIDHPLKTLLCTSTRQEEGKTTVITNIGISFAQKGERVVIIDCDLRRPALHKSFGTRRAPGLSDVLVEDVPWQNVAQETDIANLYIITSGERPRNPSELLGSARMKALMQQLREHFDRILFDISSILAVTDSAVLGPLCDGVLLTVKVQDVPRDYILQAMDIMENVGANIIGVALNGMKISRRSYYYYYYSEQAAAAKNGGEPLET
jgi:capsular exopolysaccharide synthesis family protein